MVSSHYNGFPRYLGGLGPLFLVLLLFLFLHFSLALVGLFFVSESPAHPRLLRIVRAIPRWQVLQGRVEAVVHQQLLAVAQRPRGQQRHPFHRVVPAQQPPEQGLRPGILVRDEWSQFAWKSFLKEEFFRPVEGYLPWFMVTDHSLYIMWIYVRMLHSSYKEICTRTLTGKTFGTCSFPQWLTLCAREKGFDGVWFAVRESMMVPS